MAIIAAAWQRPGGLAANRNPAPKIACDCHGRALAGDRRDAVLPHLAGDATARQRLRTQNQPLGRRMSSLALGCRAGLEAGPALLEASFVERLSASAGAGANPIG